MQRYTQLIIYREAVKDWGILNLQLLPWSMHRSPILFNNFVPLHGVDLCHNSWAIFGLLDSQIPVYQGHGHIVPTNPKACHRTQKYLSESTWHFHHFWTSFWHPQWRWSSPRRTSQIPIGHARPPLRHIYLPNPNLFLLESWTSLEEWDSVMMGCSCASKPSLVVRNFVTTREVFIGLVSQMCPSLV